MVLKPEVKKENTGQNVLNLTKLIRLTFLYIPLNFSIHLLSLDAGVVEAARERVEKLLRITPQYPVSTLDKETLVKNAELAISCCL
jgi:beta-N-acetylhexosaminidase